MATYGGFNYTNFKAVNLRTTGGIRFEMDGGKAGTLAVTSSPDASRQWYLPDKSGKIGITGTFTVNLPSITGLLTAGTDLYGTNVTVSGVRAEDAMVCTIQNMIATGASTTNRGVVLLAGCQAGNGGVYLTFANPTASATVYKDIIMAYTIVR